MLATNVNWSNYCNVKNAGKVIGKLKKFPRKTRPVEQKKF